MDLINPITEVVAKELNLTYQEMEEVETILFKLPEEQRTPETIQQLAEEIKSGKASPQSGQKDYEK